MSRGGCLQLIHNLYPELPIETIRYNSDGQNNDILILNESIIFRFPKYVGAVQELKRETSVLQSIAPYLPLPTPHPIYRSSDSETVGKVFSGYRMLPGEPLWRETLRSIAEEATVQFLATQLGTFLKALHSVPISAAPVDELPLVGYDTWADMYQRIQQKLFPSMRPDACQWTTRHFETFLNNPHNFTFKQTLIHGDFGSSNILFNAESQAISGIIDFSSVSLGDPANDFAALAMSYGDDFLMRLQQVYPAVEACLDRAHFYRGTFALQEALFGSENGDEEAFKSGLAEYV